MSNITDRQTVVISINCFNFATVVNIPPIPNVETKSQVQVPLNLRFAADELIVKNISYNGAIPPNETIADVTDVVQIWCNVTNDGIIGTFPNGGNGAIPICCYHDSHFRLNNTFQTGNLILQLQQTGSGNPASCGPQPLISALAEQTTFGIVSITLEFVKHSK